MALNANAFTTLEEVKGYLGIAGDLEDPQLEKTVNRASSRIEEYLTFPVKRQPITDRRERGVEGCELVAWAAPISVMQPISIAVNEVVQTVWRTEVDGQADLFDVVVDANTESPLWRPNVFYRRAGWGVTGMHPSPIKLTYTGGFDPVPDDLLEAFFLIVQKWHREQTQGLQEVVTVNTPTGGVTLFDRPIPFRALQILNEWRGFRV